MAPPKYRVQATNPNGIAVTGAALPSFEDQQYQRDRLLDRTGQRRPGTALSGGGSLYDAPVGPAINIPEAQLSGDTDASDYSRAVYKGLMDIAQGLAGTIELTGAMPVGSLTGIIADEAADTISKMTPSAQVNLQRKWATLDKESVFRNPKAALLQLMTVLPSVAASYGGAGIGAKIATKGLQYGTKAHGAAAGMGGAVGSAATEAAQVGGQTMTEIADMMNQIPISHLIEQSPLFARNYAKHRDEAKAREATILDASRSQAVGNALFSSLTAMLPGYVFGRQTQAVGAGRGLKNRGKRMGLGGGVESVQEGIQESGTGVGTGMAIQAHIDPEHDPYEDFAERAVAGAALGFGAGATVSAFSPGGPAQPDENGMDPAIIQALSAAGGGAQPQLPGMDDDVTGPMGPTENRRQPPGPTVRETDDKTGDLFPDRFHEGSRLALDGPYGAREGESYPGWAVNADDEPAPPPGPPEEIDYSGVPAPQLPYSNNPIGDSFPPGTTATGTPEGMKRTVAMQSPSSNVEFPAEWSEEQIAAWSVAYDKSLEPFTTPPARPEPGTVSNEIPYTPVGDQSPATTEETDSILRLVEGIPDRMWTLPTLDQVEQNAAAKKYGVRTPAKLPSVKNLKRDVKRALAKFTRDVPLSVAEKNAMGIYLDIREKMRSDAEAKLFAMEDAAADAGMLGEVGILPTTLRDITRRAWDLRALREEWRATRAGHPPLSTTRQTEMDFGTEDTATRKRAATKPKAPAPEPSSPEPTTPAQKRKALKARKKSTKPGDTRDLVDMAEGDLRQELGRSAGRWRAMLKKFVKDNPTDTAKKMAARLEAHMLAEEEAEAARLADRKERQRKGGEKGRATMARNREAKKAPGKRATHIEEKVERGRVRAELKRVIREVKAIGGLLGGVHDNKQALDLAVAGAREALAASDAETTAQIKVALDRLKNPLWWKEGAAQERKTPAHKARVASELDHGKRLKKLEAAVRTWVKNSLNLTDEVAEGFEIAERFLQARIPIKTADLEEWLEGAKYGDVFNAMGKRALALTVISQKLGMSRYRAEERLTEWHAAEKERRKLKSKTGDGPGLVGPMLDKQLRQLYVGTALSAKNLAAIDDAAVQDAPDARQREIEQLARTQQDELPPEEGHVSGSTLVGVTRDALTENLADTVVEGVGFEGEADEAELSAAPVPPRSKPRQKTQETSDEADAFQEAGAAITNAGGHGGDGGTALTGTESRAEVEDVIGPKTRVKETFNANVLEELYPNAVATLTAKQIEGINMVLARMRMAQPGIIVGDGTGSGKTLLAAVVADQVRRAGGKVLLVTTGGNDADVFPNAMEQLGVSMAGFETASYSTLTKEEGNKYDMVVYDEAHSLKNTRKGFYERYTKVTSAFNLFMTATPADMDSSLTLFAEVQGMTMVQLAKKLKIDLKEDGTVSRSSITVEYMERLADMVHDLAQEVGYFVRALPNRTQYREIESAILSEKFTDKVSGESRTLKEWDNAIAAAKGTNAEAWARSAKIAELAVLPEVLSQMDAALKDNTRAKVIIMAQQHGSQPLKWTDVNGGKHELQLPSILDRVLQHLEEAGQGDTVSRYFGNKYNAGAKQFQNDPKIRVLLTTYGKASESISLDDTVGDAPRTLISTLSDWSAAKEDQARGRIDRASTASTPTFISLRAGGFVADTVRNSRLQSKHEMLKVLRGEERSPHTYANNTEVREAGDRVHLILKGLDYDQKVRNSIKRTIKIVSGGFPQWSFDGVRESHSISRKVWPEVEAAVKAQFEDAATAMEAKKNSKLEKPSETQPEVEAVVEAAVEEFVETVADQSESEFDHPIFATEAALAVADSMDILHDDLAARFGDGVTVDQVGEYWNEITGSMESQSFDYSLARNDLLSDGEPVMAKNVLREIQKGIKRSSPMYDLLRTMIQRIGATTVQLDETAHFEYAGAYRWGSNQVRISPNGNTAKTVIHEAIHAVLGHTIETNPEFRRKVLALKKEFIASLRAGDLSAEMQSIVDDILATTDENGHEFMSYMLTEPEMQRVMQRMPSKTSPKRSLWQKFKSLVAKVLRLNRRARTALDDVIDLAKEGATTERLKEAPDEFDSQMSQSFTDETSGLRGILKRTNENYNGPRTRAQLLSAARRTTVMGVLTLRQMESMYKPVLSKLGVYNPVKEWLDALYLKEQTQKQFGRRGQTRFRAHRKVEAAHPEFVTEFRDIIDEATTYEVYPDLPLSDPLNKGANKEHHRRLRDRFKQIPKPMQTEFKDLYQWYKDERTFELREQVKNVLEIMDTVLEKGTGWVKLTAQSRGQIADDLLAGERKASDLHVLNQAGDIDFAATKAVTEALTMKQQHSLARGPYFPKKRFGEFVAYGELGRETVSVSLSTADIDELSEAATKYTKKKVGVEADGSFSDLQQAVFDKRLKQLKRASLARKLNASLDKKSKGDIGWQRANLEYNTNDTSATRDHYLPWYSQHDSFSEAEKVTKYLAEQGYVVPFHESEEVAHHEKVGRRPDDLVRIQGAYGPLLSAMKSKLKKHQEEGRGAEYDRLITALESSMLATMPETAIRKELLKRKNIPGNTKDAGRALAAHIRGAGAYRGQLLHGRAISEAMAKVNAAHTTAERDNKYSQSDQDKIQAVVNEVRKHDALDSAGGELGELSRGMANVGFLWVLLSPVYLLVNLTQPGMFTLPWLSARSTKGGTMRAGRFLGNAYGSIMPEFISRTGKALKGIAHLNVDQELFDFLDPESGGVGRALAARILKNGPRAQGGTGRLKHTHELVGKDGKGGLLARLAERNLLDMTLAADTRSAALGREQEGVWERTLDSARILPHLTEVLNRGVTAVAAYEMGRDEGMTIEQATQFAEDAIAETQFDYNLLNKPRYMSERSYAAAKPIFMFMQHPQHVYALFVKSALFGTKGAKKYYALKLAKKFEPDNPVHQQYERDFKVNRDTVMGILGTHLLMGGVAGAMFEPVKWAMGFVLMLSEMFSGEPPEDTKVYIHRWLTGLFGEEGGEVAMHGLPWLLDMNLSNNLSISNLATFDTRFPTGREGVKDRLFAGTGPLPSLVGNVMEGIDDIKRGDYMTGLARMSPRTLRELIRAASAADVGIRDNRGNTLINAEDISAYELFLSSLGISTAQKTKMYENRAATQNLKYGLLDQKNALKRRLKVADTPGKRRTVVAAISKWNRTQPFDSRIDVFGAEQSAAESQRQITKGGGAHLTNKELHLRQEL